MITSKSQQSESFFFPPLLQTDQCVNHVFAGFFLVVHTLLHAHLPFLSALLSRMVGPAWWKNCSLASELLLYLKTMKQKTGTNYAISRNVDRTDHDHSSEVYHLEENSLPSINVCKRIYVFILLMCSTDPYASAELLWKKEGNKNSLLTADLMMSGWRLQTSTKSKTFLKAFRSNQ